MDLENEKKKIESEIQKIDEELSKVAADIDGAPNDDEDLDYFDYDNMNDPSTIYSELHDEKQKKLSELRRVRVQIERGQAREQINKSRSIYVKGNIISDKDTEIDLLNRDLCATVLANYICNKKTETPFNIGVFGEWGEGKSSFLKLIERKIINKNDILDKDSEKRVHVIRYDASQYSEQDKIWASILKESFSNFDKERWFLAKPLFAFSKFITDLKENSWKWIVRLLLLLFVTACSLIISKNINILTDIRKLFIFGTIGLIPAIMLLTNIVIPFLKKQLEFVQPLSDRLITNMELPNYREDLGIRENIKDNLQTLVNIWLKKVRSGEEDCEHKERLVIMVDELDRCSEKVITEFFEALQLFLPIKSIVIILSLSYESVCYSLANKHINYFDTKEISNTDKLQFGIKYIQKYINIPIFLSSPNSFDEFLERLLSEVNYKNEASIETNNGVNAFKTNVQNKTKSTEVDSARAIDSQEKNKMSTLEENEIKIIKSVVKHMNSIKHITPREIKKVINILILSKDMYMSANTQSKFYDGIIYENYIRWFLFSYFYPVTSFAVLEKIKGKDSFLVEEMEFLSGDNEIIIQEQEIGAKILIKKLINKVCIDDIKMFSHISGYFIFYNNI